MLLKIKRHEYNITEKDEFMDNGSSVQLLTQSRETSTWGSRPNPILSKKAIKQLLACEHERTIYDSSWSKDTTIIKIKGEE
jgi:hypothetical protein